MRERQLRKENSTAVVSKENSAPSINIPFKPPVISEPIINNNNDVNDNDNDMDSETESEMDMRMHMNVFECEDDSSLKYSDSLDGTPRDLRPKT